MAGTNKYMLHGRIWIEIGNNTVIGEGKAALLRKTAELGSLRKASALLKMSYRQAWYSLNQMNKSSGEPLIKLHRGGRNGGTAQITESGKELLSLFERSQREFERFLNEQTLVLDTSPVQKI